jgi:molybdenum cofactor biosynthesis enzyme MoaA
MTNYRCERALDSLVLYDRGDVWLCCPDATHSPLGCVLRGDDLLALWRGPRARAVREGIAHGTFALCTRCPHLPAPFGPVTETNSSTVPDAWRIPMLSVSFDRACNLRCPSCRRGSERPRDDVRTLYDYLLSSTVLDEVDTLRLLGSGEPLYSRECLDFLCRVPWEKYPRLRIHLQTNGLLLTRERYLALGRSRERISEVSVSVDAYHRDTYEQNRSLGPTDWHTLLTNLMFAGELKKGGNVERLTLVFVVQANNFREMVPFATWATGMGACARFLKLYNWGTYTDEEYRERAVHLPGHPMHEAYARESAHQIFRDPRVTKAWR